MRVFVYWNLHRHCWSVKALEGDKRGRVVAHAQRVNLTGCRFKVSEAGRQRVLREQRKNVHAGVVGEWDGHGDASLPAWADGAGRGVTYNPYKGAHFVARDTGEAVDRCDVAHLAQRTVTAWGV